MSYAPLFGFAVIAATLVNTLLTGLIGSAALIVGLAFGLGGRDVAAQITQKWYESSQIMADTERQRAGNPTSGDAKVYRANPPSETEPPR